MDRAMESRPRAGTFKGGTFQALQLPNLFWGSLVNALADRHRLMLTFASRHLVGPAVPVHIARAHRSIGFGRAYVPGAQGTLARALAHDAQRSLARTFANHRRLTSVPAGASILVRVTVGGYSGLLPVVLCRLVSVRRRSRRCGLSSCGSVCCRRARLGRRFLRACGLLRHGYNRQTRQPCNQKLGFHFALLVLDSFLRRAFPLEGETREKPHFGPFWRVPDRAASY